jgi:septal ring-binding cell division protein DamX
MSQPFLFIGRIAAGIACLLLALFVFYPHRYATLSFLSDFKADPKVFRTKIPEEILIAQNFFRGKFPVVNQPAKTPAKIERLSPVEKKEVPFPPIVAPPKQSYLRRENAFGQPVESQIMIETSPPLAKAVPSQSTDSPPEQSEPRQETKPHSPVELQKNFETALPAEEITLSSRSAAAPSEQIELPEKVDLRQAEVRPQPVKEDVIEKTQERVIHDEKWLLSQVSSYYTIQLMGVRKEVLLFSFVEKNQLLEQNETAFYETTFEDKPWFQLLYGVYATKKDAQAAADNLPLKIRKASPWIRRLSAIQKAIRGKMSP